jgi:hypothetical protein
MEAGRLRSWINAPQARRLIPVAVGVIAVLVVWLAVRGSDNGHKASSKPASAPVTHSAPVAASRTQLVALAKALRHPLYWVPSVTGSTIELTRFSDGGVLLRYLPRGVALGSPSHAYLAIGTYPARNAYALVARAAAERGATVDHLSGGGLGVTRTFVPHSVYVAFPGPALLAEVYDPSPKLAHELVRTGQVQALAG